MVDGYGVFFMLSGYLDPPMPGRVNKGQHKQDGMPLSIAEEDLIMGFVFFWEHGHHLH